MEKIQLAAFRGSTRTCVVAVRAGPVGTVSLLARICLSIMKVLAEDRVSGRRAVELGPAAVGCKVGGLRGVAP